MGSANRASRRKTSKTLRKHGVSQDMIKLVSKIKDSSLPNAHVILEGDKVKINVTRIMADCNYKRMQPAYRAFIEKHTNTVFSAIYDKVGENGENLKPPFICLAEDKHSPRWLFLPDDLLVWMKKEKMFVPYFEYDFDYDDEELICTNANDGMRS